MEIFSARFLPVLSLFFFSPLPDCASDEWNNQVSSVSLWTSCVPRCFVVARISRVKVRNVSFNLVALESSLLRLSRWMDRGRGGRKKSRVNSKVDLEVRMSRANLAPGRVYRQVFTSDIVRFSRSSCFQRENVSAFTRLGTFETAANGRQFERRRSYGISMASSVRYVSMLDSARTYLDLSDSKRKIRSRRGAPLASFLSLVFQACPHR